MYDTHVHTTFSHDGKSTMEDYRIVYIERGIKAVGFTEHLDYLPIASGYGKFKYIEFCDEIKRLKKEGCNFHIGAEVGYTTDIEEDINEGIKDKKFEYIIGAVHRVNGLPMSAHKFYDFIEAGGPYMELIGKYYESVEKSLEMKAFDIIAHIGIYKKWLTADVRACSKTTDIINQLDSELAKKCAKSDKIIEINTSGLFSEFKSTIPDRNFLKIYREHGGNNISLASDTHSAQGLLRGFDDAIDMLGGLGFKYISLPWDKEHPISIDEYNR